MAAFALAATAAAGCALADASAPPAELTGTIVWTLAREVDDPSTPGRRESATTTVEMDVALRMTRSRAGVAFLQAHTGTWTATGIAAASDGTDECTVHRATDTDLHGQFAGPNNMVTLVHTPSAHRALLGFSVSKGDGAVIATTRYCDGTEVSQNRTYFWTISDAAIDVTVERAPDGTDRFIVSKEQTAPCGAGATCTRTASGVLTPSASMP